MMRGFKLNADHDWDLSGGDLVQVSGIEAAAQEANTRIRLWLGEYFLDLSAGFPYLQLVFKKNPDLSLIEKRMAALVETVDGILPGVLVETALDRAARALAITWRATYKGGPLSGVVIQGAETPTLPTFLVAADGNFLVTTSGDFIIES